MCSLLVLAFYFFPERAGVATSLLHVEASGYEGYGRSTVVGFSQNYIIPWMWSVLRLAICWSGIDLDLKLHNLHLAKQRNRVN